MAPARRDHRRNAVEIEFEPAAVPRVVNDHRGPRLFLWYRGPPVSRFVVHLPSSRFGLRLQITSLSTLRNRASFGNLGDHGYHSAERPCSSPLPN